MRAIRGAICARANSRDEIHGAAGHLLMELVRRNGLRPSEIVAIFFTMTPDLNADFPAYAARDLGWTGIAMLGAQESMVPGAPPRAIRVLVLAEGSGQARHVYLGEAAAMRPDLTEPGDEEAWPLERSGVGPRPAETDFTDRLLVVGTGLIGGSLAVVARRSGLVGAVVGFDRDRSRSVRALERGLLDSAAESLDAELGRADMVALAMPVEEIVELLPRMGSLLKPGAVVTDVGSTKRRIVEEMDKLPASVRAVGGHPLAGSTDAGPDAASADLFRGARWAIVPCGRSDEASLRRVEGLIAAAGARPLRVGAEEHDALVAVTSHLPACLAVALVRTVERLAGGAGRPWLAGPAFASATRLVRGDAVMTSQMLSQNSEQLREALQEFGRQLQLVSASLADPGQLEATLLRASQSLEVLSRR